jgi:rubrerythrin
MIRVALPNLIFIPFLFTLVAVFLASVYYSARGETRKVKGARARIYRCAVCYHVYVDSRDVPLARCPRCGCLNEAVKR